MAGKVHLQIKRIEPSVPLVFTWWNTNECRTEAVLVECSCFKHSLYDDDGEGEKDWARQLKSSLEEAEVVSLNKDNAEVLGFEENYWFDVLEKNKWMYGLQKRTRRRGIDNVQVNLVQEIPKEFSQHTELQIESEVEGMLRDIGAKLAEGQDDETDVRSMGDPCEMGEEHNESEDFLAAESLQRLNHELTATAEYGMISEEDAAGVVTEQVKTEMDPAQVLQQLHDSGVVHLSQSHIITEETLHSFEGNNDAKHIPKSVAYPVKMNKGLSDGILFQEEVEISTSRGEDNIPGTSLTLQGAQTGEDGNVTITNIEGAENAEGIKVALSSLGVCGDKEMINLDAVVIQHIQPNLEADDAQNQEHQTVVVPITSEMPLGTDVEGTVSLARFLEDLFQSERALDGKQTLYGKNDEVSVKIEDDNVVILRQPEDHTTENNTTENNQLMQNSSVYDDTQNKLESGNFYICEICGKVIAKRYMRSHSRAHENQFDLSPSARKKWKCDICQKVLISDKKVHMRRHSGEKPYNCRYCDKKFVATSERFFHEKRQHLKDYQYGCEICGRKFLKKVSMLRHVEAHKRGTAITKKGTDGVDRKKIQQSTYAKRKTQFGFCKVCSKKLPKTSLYEHQRRHLNLRPFQCTFCPSTFTTKGNMLDHMNVHTGNTPYKCKFCDKSYTRRYSLIVHERAHTGERPYTCPVCNKGWRESYGYKLHMQKYHPDIVDPTVRVRPRKRDK